jgi:gluconokinase
VHPVIVGLDVGTTGAKAVAFRAGTEWRRAAEREYRLEPPEVQDPETVMDAVLAVLAECAPDAVDAIAVGTAMHGLIGLDEDRRPVTPLLTWADPRATSQAEALRPRARELLARTGTPVHPMSPLTKLIWFRECDPDTAARVRHWVGLKDYVLLRLTGELVTELSTASASGLLNLRERRWDAEALELAGVTAGRLPPIHATTDTLPLQAAIGGIPAGVPVVLGATDGPLGNLGTGALGGGVAGLSLGTSGAIRMVVDEPRPDPAGALFCYALTADRWVVGGSVSNGGIVVRWAHDALAPDLEGDAALLALAASVPAGSEGLAMLPYLMAERAPLWAPELPGAYLGLRRHHTRAHLTRAAIEGVCLQLATILDRLDALQPVTEVRVTGGAFRAQLWRDVLAATLDRPLVAVGDAEGTALGAAALGLLALGHADSLEAALRLLPSPSMSEPVAPDPALVQVYARSRAAVPELIRALGAVADLLAAAT